MVSDLVNADLPVKARPQPVSPYGPLAFYVEGVYATGDRADRSGGAGSNYNVGGVTFGADYRIAPTFLVGLAFNYSSAKSNLTQGWGDVTTDAYQLAGYASWTDRNWFADAAISGGWNKLNITRPGLVSAITGSPDGSTFVAQGKAGYLFDIASFGVGSTNASAVKAGPIAGFTYSHTRINAYTETGDPMLNQSVDGQSVDGFTGRAGIEIRSAYLWNAWRVSPWLAVTAEHDFDKGSRVLTTAQTYALALTIATPVTSNTNDTFGRVAGGISAQVAQNVSLNLSGEATFARDSGNDYAVTGGVKVVW